ncbi:voltage-dependent calcium channel gamma-like subunit [Bombina bombina]|uniref:voltage-dependent calcium channel gamma-like subunit n=1 Tax=Bombina bombina TaxID=8345 RepID=UPI00235A98B5|nr:voltage-dependent calcium channel gamma-like subunit [Bombina bombina]
MTAISVQMQKAVHPQPGSRMFFETFLRVLITISVALAVVLSSISVCDGQWLSYNGERLFGVWDICRNGVEIQCSLELVGLSHGMVAVRSLVSLAVVVAIFGLELLMVSQLCEDGLSRKKWKLGSVLLLASFLLASAGTLTYVLLLKEYIALSSFTLTFWCQFLGVFLFNLNGISGLYINRLTA